MERRPYACLFLQKSHHRWNAQRQSRNIGNSQKQQEKNSKVGKQSFCNLLNADLTDSAAYEQYRTYRRSDVAHAHVKDQHNAELNVGHAQAFCNRQEDGGENQDSRCNIHKHTYNQQNNVHQKKNHIFVCGYRHNG